MYLDYCDYEERFILQNSDVNDFSYNFAFNTPTRLYTFNINLLLTGKRTGNRNIFRVTSTNRISGRMKFIKRRKITFLDLNCNLLFHFYLLKRYSKVAYSKISRNPESLDNFFRRKVALKIIII